jgi:hypothetical protein
MEVSRFARAAAESSFTITECSRLPSSRAWQTIQWYYAAFYAAHALLRMFGTSLTYLERGHARAVNTNAQLFGFAGSAVTAGFYLVDTASSAYGPALRFRHYVNTKGSHDDLWKETTTFLETQSKDVLKNTLVSTRDAQDISQQLVDLALLLRTAPHRDGTWMSALRNDVTYRHTRSAWYPWRPTHGLDSLYEKKPERLRDVTKMITSATHAKNDLSRLRHVSHALLALCRVTCDEMKTRCPRGRSFQTAGLAALDSLIAQR